MTYLTVERATKQYSEAFKALDDVSLSVEQGEFFTLLGPSGCGKTTLLRAIAGFNDLTSGNISLSGTDLLRIPPHQRDIGMVFQDYAVFPHLSVFDNVAFGLKPRRVPKAETKTRVDDALAAVRLSALASRMPAAMSGGQQQRIGIARAMVIKPRLLLMDEPLSNLDAKLRIELREEIRDIQKLIDIASIYVTHDQEEALAISDRICVMNGGHVEQVGTPEDIYGDPQTFFVASFVGTINNLKHSMTLNKLLQNVGLGEVRAHTWAIRPERLRIGGNDTPNDGFLIEGTVNKYTYLGREAHLQVDTHIGELVIQIANPGRKSGYSSGDKVSITVPRDGLMAFDISGQRIAGGR